MPALAGRLVLLAHTLSTGSCKHDRFLMNYAILNRLEMITKHNARRDASTLRLPVKDEADESAEVPTARVALLSGEIPKTPHSLKCVVVAMTTLALTSTLELLPERAVQIPASLLNMKCSDASLAPV